MYKIKEIFYTLQGEGFHAGRPAVFVRFSGCNLWTGREEDRHKAVCKFCDTDFWGMDGQRGGKYDAKQLINTIYELWPSKSTKHPFIVITGGEPALQLDQELVDALHEANVEIAIETNGTLALPDHIDWVCVSPKADTQIVLHSAHELKLVYPQVENTPEQYEHIHALQYYLQPLDDENQEAHTAACVDYCMAHPKWQLSLQTHKIIGVE